MSTENVTPHPSVLKRSEARLGAVQALYSYEINENRPNVTQLIINMIQYYEEEQAYTPAMIQPDIDFMSLLIKGTLQNIEDIDETIKENLGDGWNIERIGSVMRAILRVASYELLTQEKIPFKVIIDEYVRVTTYYFDEKEIGFVNGILDKMARQSRPEDS